MLDSSRVKEIATQLGFDLCGITRAEPLPESQVRFNNWLEQGFGAPLEYLSNYNDIRFDSSRIIEGGKSVIVCAMNYRSEQNYDPTQPRIASYALNRDYHKTVKKRLKHLLQELKKIYPRFEGRPFCDSAPLLEKQLAHNAGLGWIGRQSLLITPQFGTYIHLGELVVNLSCNNYDIPVKESLCRGCRLCIERCPVGAINEDQTIDTRRCISCRTVEMKTDNSELTLSNWVFGCDECQICCPHNLNKPIHKSADFDNIVVAPSKNEWQAMTPDEFQKITLGTPIKRSSLERIQRLIKKS